MRLTISIPTYNRSKDLLYNLSLLEDIIVTNNLVNEVCVLVSNNCSVDDTQVRLNDYGVKSKIKLLVFNQDTNIGLEANFLFVIEHAITDFVMLLGDDDYINTDYLLSCYSSIKSNPNVQCIFGCYKAIDSDKNDLGGGRDLDLPTKEWEPGINSAIENTAKFHQMSGIVFNKTVVIEIYKNRNIHNLYPQIFIGTYLCLYAKTKQITHAPILVTQTAKKAWSYGNDGLIQDVFQNYRALNLSFYNRYRLENSFISNQIWRIWQYKTTHNFWNCVFKVCFGKNTSILGSVLLFAKIVKNVIFAEFKK